MSGKRGYRVQRLSRARLALAAGQEMAGRRHLMFALVEADLTAPIQLMAQYQARCAEKLSLAGYVLLVTAGGFPLEIAMFEGNKAETKTLIPVIEQFKTRHGITELVVVADAGMLSASNLNALEDAGARFIVGSRQSHVPYDLDSHFTAHGNYTPDDSTIETVRDMGSDMPSVSRTVG